MIVRNFVKLKNILDSKYLSALLENVIKIMTQKSFCNFYMLFKVYYFLRVIRLYLS